jgi:hypothetical protein
VRPPAAFIAKLAEHPARGGQHAPGEVMFLAQRQGCDFRHGRSLRMGLQSQEGNNFYASLGSQGYFENGLFIRGLTAEVIRRTGKTEAIASKPE